MRVRKTAAMLRTIPSPTPKPANPVLWPNASWHSLRNQNTTGASGH